MGQKVDIKMATSMTDSKRHFVRCAIMTICAEQNINNTLDEICEKQRTMLNKYNIDELVALFGLNYNAIRDYINSPTVEKIINPIGKVNEYCQVNSVEVKYSFTEYPGMKFKCTAEIGDINMSSDIRTSKKIAKEEVATMIYHRIKG